MKLTIQHLKEMIKEEFKNELLLDDETFQQDSVLVPNDIKEKIKDYLKKMKLT